MSVPVQVLTVLAAGVVTFASRVTFLVRSSPGAASDEGTWFGRFLEAFPVALFVSLAVVQALAPEGSLEAGPPLVGLAVGAVVCVFTRRIVPIMLAGWLAALLAASLL